MVVTGPLLCSRASQVDIRFLRSNSEPADVDWPQESKRLCTRA
jgi:hypothetical protein